jgi:hypothetical protein
MASSGAADFSPKLVIVQSLQVQQVWVDNWVQTTVCTRANHHAKSKELTRCVQNSGIMHNSWLCCRRQSFAPQVLRGAVEEPTLGTVYLVPRHRPQQSFLDGTASLYDFFLKWAKKSLSPLVPGGRTQTSTQNPCQGRQLYPRNEWHALGASDID